ncbi:hypothetical protein [Microbacterium sp. Root180]|uniref:hypothetical protein n=1 Tax=Microbacterium sp. Root180 TaxID=1736483 RepID=UPI000A413BB9|nr:hypothetical protein [Microbacterium sp. Root180]
MMHSTATTTLPNGPARRVSSLGAALLAIAGNVLVLVILGVAAVIVAGAAVLVFGGGLAEAL